MTLDYTAINAALFNRVATASAGSAVRALAGTNGIFEREGLASLAGRVFPWFVWAEIDVGGESGDMRPMVGSWFTYVPKGGNAFQLLTNTTALETLYGGANGLVVPWGRVKVVHISRAFDDTKIPARGMEVRLAYSRRG
jgi:hypothetical protein